MEILNKCKKPPLGLARQVRRCLSWIDGADSEGLSHIELIDELPDVKDFHPKWYQDALTSNRGILGWYNEKEINLQAYITLHVKQIYWGVPSRYWWTPVPTLRIMSTLAHEVAHHLVATRGYIFQSGERFEKEWHEEAAANRYTFGVISRMKASWYYRAGLKSIANLAETHYRLGARAWRKKKYQEAAQHWDQAGSLNPVHRNARHWYWRALNKLESDGLSRA